MTIQMVGAVKFAPARDLVYLWPHILLTTAERLQSGPYKPLSDFLVKQGVTMDELAEALNIYGKFLLDCQMGETTHFTEAFESSGWFNVRWEAQIAVMYYSGMTMCGSFYQGVREATAGDDPTTLPIQRLLDAGSVFSVYAMMPAWRRWLFRYSRLFRRLVWRSLGTHYDVR